MQSRKSCKNGFVAGKQGYKYKECSEYLSEPEVSGSIKEMEFDDMWHFVGSKKNKLWVINAVDRGTGHTVAWVLSGRDVATFRRLYDNVKDLKDCMFYTDDWDTFVKVL